MIRKFLALAAALLVGILASLGSSVLAANPIWGHFILICFSDTVNGGTPCTGAPSHWTGIGGTSASAPLMAAIQALVNQHWNIRAGNPNPTYYSIAKTQFGTKGNPSCYSINETTGNACVFNDITHGDIDVNCQFNGNVFKADCYLPSGTNGAISTQRISSLTLKKGRIRLRHCTGLHHQHSQQQIEIHFSDRHYDLCRRRTSQMHRERLRWRCHRSNANGCGKRLHRGSQMHDRRWRRKGRNLQRRDYTHHRRQLVSARIRGYSWLGHGHRPGQRERL